MTEPLDDPRLGEQRQRAATSVVTAWYRLVRACQLYDDANQSVGQLAEGVVEAIAAFCQLHDDVDSVRVLFSDELVFVNRRIMRAARETYAMALQLGELCGACGVTDVLFQRQATADAVRAYTRLLLDGQRDPAVGAKLLEDPIAGITSRDTVLDQLAETASESPEARLVKAYAAAILILQSFFGELERGELHNAHEVKRIAQKLVSLSGAHPELLVALAAAPLADDSPARHSVSTAVIAVAMARQLTDDRAALTTIALAALLSEVGRWREELPAAETTAVATLINMTRIAKLYDGALQRTVVAFEALSMAGPLAGVYAGTTAPCLQGSLLYVARRFNQLRIPTAGTRSDLAHAIHTLQQELSAPEEQPFLRLLDIALGLFPVGALVELSTGEVAMVTGVPAVALDFARPPVRILSDGTHKVLDRPLDIDLVKATAGGTPRSIERVVSTELSAK